MNKELDTVIEVDIKIKESGFITSGKTRLKTALELCEHQSKGFCAAGDKSEVCDLTPEGCRNGKPFIVFEEGSSQDIEISH